MSILYTAKASAVAGRNGRAFSDDSRLEVSLSMPKALGGDDGPGTNPEQLFAAGYSACFLSAMKLVASQSGLELSEQTRVSAEVGIGPRSEGGFGLVVALIASVPGLSVEQANELLVKTEQVCPYSNATRGNVKTTLKLA